MTSGSSKTTTASGWAAFWFCEHFLCIRSLFDVLSKGKIFDEEKLRKKYERILNTCIVYDAILMCLTSLGLIMSYSVW